MTAGSLLSLNHTVLGRPSMGIPDSTAPGATLFETFKNPPNRYRPFVRWWWNGGKIEKVELARELALLKAAGIGGVEINTIAFPDQTDDMGRKTAPWLSDQWVDLVDFTLEEARRLDMECDLLVGSGFPAGGEFLEGEERSQIVSIGVKKIQGPLRQKYSLFDLIKEADPGIYRPYSGREPELLKVQLVPDPFNSMDDVIDLSDQIAGGTITVEVPDGRYALYALVKFEGFMRVIKGVPGGMGPVLNTFSATAVKKYLNHMSSTIQDRIGPLAGRVRSFFVDSLEQEGANWTKDMLATFKQRRGYDLYPYLPFILFKIGRMGNTVDPDYPAVYGKALQADLDRVRYDFARTKAELFKETFIDQLVDWCRENKVKSRVQAYGRNYFLLEGSFDIDIPECETWLKYGIGEDIPEEAFTRYPWHLGQGNTMINKFVSSAAHLKDKRLVSSEELTNTEMVFNETLEVFKIAGDQSTISGVTQPVFHGFNYSPKEAPFPGWVTWGCYFNEKNTFWPYFKHYTDYRTRLSYILQQLDMYADIALLAPIPDMWSRYGAQNEPFPAVVYPDYQLLIWESIQENGSGCDYVSEAVIRDATISDATMHYGNRNYKALFLIDVEGIDPATAEKMHAFIAGGGRIFCIERYPDKSVGWKDYTEKDAQVRDWVQKMKMLPDRFILLDKPEGNFALWYRWVQEKYKISAYVSMKETKRHLTQARYQNEDLEVLFFINASNQHHYTVEATVADELTKGRKAWLWDPVKGERYPLAMEDRQLTLPMGPAESKLLVFSKEAQEGGSWASPPQVATTAAGATVAGPWTVTFQSLSGQEEQARMPRLIDLKEDPDHKNFGGTLLYRNRFRVPANTVYNYLNLGKVHGISEVTLNGKTLGVQWYGDRIYPVAGLLQEGEHTLEVKVVTVMGNYMKSLLDNPIAQYWTNEGHNDQPLHAMGLVGPVTLY